MTLEEMLEQSRTFNNDDIMRSDWLAPYEFGCHDERINNETLIVNGKRYGAEKPVKRSIRMAIIDEINHIIVGVEIYKATDIDVTEKCLRQGMNDWYNEIIFAHMADEPIGVLLDRNGIYHKFYAPKVDEDDSRNPRNPYGVDCDELIIY